MRILRSFRVGALAMLLLAGCGSSVGPTVLSPEMVAGDYVMVSYSGITIGDGPGQVTGALRLHAIGGVERRLTYRSPDGSASVQSLVGSFSLAGHGLQLTLLSGSYAWRPPVTLDGRVLTLTYPSPADGPDIVERYARQ